MLDRDANPGAWLELRRLAKQKVWDITDDEADGFASSGLSIFEWTNTSSLGAAWRARVDVRMARRILPTLARWWRRLISPSPAEGVSE